ncbi:MAG: RagB/SusD family nutrient uptake outer membrane protein [Prevotella sp.]|nr:RagB/SusD family nutrient uptake outer membrane protein [Prevotella sp.]
MKKLSIILMSVLAVGFASCDMDKTPYDAIPDTEALTSPTDFENARVGLYSALRSSVGNETFWNSTDIQCDHFHAVDGFSNNMGDQYRWIHTANTSRVATVYGNYQAIISRANFILDGYEKVDMSNELIFTPSGKASIEKTVGECYFMRAYALLGLAQYFCADYEESNADAADGGVSFSTVYNPSSDPGTYPGRYTLRETFKQIYADLDEAAKRITAAGTPSDIYVSADAVQALKARAALACDDYATAAAAAAKVINGGSFTLAADEDELIDLWQQDGGNETILQLAVASRDELPDQVGQVFQPYQEGSVPDYVPTQTLIDLYSADDIRFAVYFNKPEFITNKGVTNEAYCFNKYIDHTRLYEEFSKYDYARYVIEPKVFRIAEMYLIAAEAYAQAGDLTNAAKYLNELEASRIADYENQTFASKDAFMMELRAERQREMVGEGQRLFDLKRWHQGLQRGVPQQEDICLLPGTATTALTKSANDPKWVWPIPKHETDANPKVKQNPGYTN